MAEPIPFRTGRDLSTDAFVVITAGVNRADLSTAELAAKNRQWAITAAAAGANMPVNPYRASVTIDNTRCDKDAYIVVTTSDDPAYTLGWVAVKAGNIQTFSRHDQNVGTESLSVVLTGTSGTSSCLISERSFV